MHHESVPSMRLATLAATPSSFRSASCPRGPQCTRVRTLRRSTLGRGGRAESSTDHQPGQNLTRMRQTHIRKKKSTTPIRISPRQLHIRTPWRRRRGWTRRGCYRASTWTGVYVRAHLPKPSPLPRFAFAAHHHHRPPRPSPPGASLRLPASGRCAQGGCPWPGSTSQATWRASASCCARASSAAACHGYVSACGCAAPVCFWRVRCGSGLTLSTALSFRGLTRDCAGLPSASGAGTSGWGSAGSAGPLRQRTETRRTPYPQTQFASATR